LTQRVHRFCAESRGNKQILPLKWLHHQFNRVKMQNTHLKQQLRAHSQALRVGVSPTDRASATASIAARLAQLPAYRMARAVLGYCGDAQRGEIETLPLLQSLLESGKLLALPRVVGDVADGKMVLHEVVDLSQLQRSKLGLLEPPINALVMTLSTLDLIIIPGTAFDRKGNRLGAGGGFYDRLLAVKNHPTTVALAFDCQLVDAVPMQQHDVAMDFIITESQTIDCKT
jgi:5-formyltetrahydrofolate cyclo-ligase